MGHAVYSDNDPRAAIFKNYVAKLAQERIRSLARISIVYDGRTYCSSSHQWKAQNLQRSQCQYRLFSGLFITCWICQKNCIHQCLLSRGSSAGPPIGSKNWSTHKNHASRLQRSVKRSGIYRYRVKIDQNSRGSLAAVFVLFTEKRGIELLLRIY